MRRRRRTGSKFVARPLLALVAILKNEAKSVRALLESVRGVADHVVILDTGSTDGTQALARDVLDVPVEIVEEPFIPYRDTGIINFAATRNRALDLEGGRDVFTLFLSGDEVLHGCAALRTFLEEHRESTEDAFVVEMRSGHASWLFPRVLRTDGGRRYQRPIHEVPVGKNGEQGGFIVLGVHVVHDNSDKQRLFTRMREVDLPLLTRIAEDPSTPAVERAWATHFIAQTHENLVSESPSKKLLHQFSALAYYQQRIDMSGDKDDVNYARFRRLNVAEMAGIYTSEEMVERLEDLVKEEPRRPEVWYMLAAHAARMDPRRGAFLAVRAVEIAQAVRKAPLHLPTDGRCEWLSLRIAAECAKALGYTSRARKLAEQGILAGGPREMFENCL